MTFKPTYLYIKTHKITGLKYFGKTIKNPNTYLGSGIRWRAHLKKHGNDVFTEILNNGQAYTNEEIFKEDAINFSIKFNIVNSEEWANLMIEQGAGGDTSASENYKKSMKMRNMKGENNPMYGKTPKSKGKTLDQLYDKETADKIRESARNGNIGRKLSTESKLKMGRSISLSTKGRPKSEEFRMKMKKPKSEDHKEKLRGPKPVVKCDFCNKIGGISQMKRWHFNNCRIKNENN